MIYFRQQSIRFCGAPHILIRIFENHRWTAVTYHAWREYIASDGQYQQPRARARVCYNGIAYKAYRGVRAYNEFARVYPTGTTVYPLHRLQRRYVPEAASLSPSLFLSLC